MKKQRLSIPITEVTVYPESARITRKLNIDFQTGTNQFRFINLPSSLTEDSLRVELPDDSGLVLKEVHVINRHVENRDENQYRIKEKELTQLTIEKSKIIAMIRNLNQEFNLFLNKNPLPGKNTSIEHWPLETVNWEEYLNFIQSGLLKNRKNQSDLIFKLIDLENKIQGINENLNQFQSYDQIKEHLVEIIINAKSEGSFPLSIHYLQPGVSWYPAYTLRASTEEKELSLQFFSMISQQTGEDWNDIGLLLSTAIPMENCDVPNLYSKRIRESKQEIIEEPAQEVFDQMNDMPAAMKMEAAKEINLSRAMGMKAPSPKRKRMDEGKKSKIVSAENLSQNLYQNSDDEMQIMMEKQDQFQVSQQAVSNNLKRGFKDLQQVSQQITQDKFSLQELPEEYQIWRGFQYENFDPKSQLPKSAKIKIKKSFRKGISPQHSLGGYDYRYPIKSKKNNIPSFGIPIQTPVDIRSMNINLVYMSVPLEREEVFLKALFKNQSETPLPSGPAQIYVDNNLLGNINFPSLGRNQGSSISLGIDRDIKILRRENYKQQTLGLMKKEMLREYQIEIEIMSYKDKPVNLELFDRIPLSQKKNEIAVQDLKFSTNPLVISNRNILKWKVLLNPQEKQIIKFSYGVKYPEDYRLTQKKADSPHYEKEEVIND